MNELALIALGFCAGFGGAWRALSARMEAAQHDALTGLPNYTAFLASVDSVIAHAARSRHQVAILFIDLNGYKAVNDTHGHRAGDDILILVAKRIRESVRATDALCRRSGDEFIVCGEVADYASLQLMAQRLDEALAAPYEVSGRSIDGVSAAIGVSLFPAGTATAAQMLEVADRAMYAAKGSGQRVRFAHECEVAA